MAGVGAYYHEARRWLLGRVHGKFARAEDLNGLDMEGYDDDDCISFLLNLMDRMGLQLLLARPVSMNTRPCWGQFGRIKVNFRAAVSPIVVHISEKLRQCRKAFLPMPNLRIILAQVSLRAQRRNAEDNHTD